ncbi:hypothetical protein MKEN_00846400 [Mycena kentingensis (nom. inval.)]|nr:hypothetical protein MKEN_00846400 [Mycena kentingensis (nom. inval.)]
MATPTMPARGAHTAPKFNPDNPHEMRCYFDDVEFLLKQAAITDNKEMKEYSTKYLPVPDQELLEGLAEFADAAKTLADFRAEALKLYAGNDPDNLHTVREYDSLLGNIARVGIHSERGLSDFFRTFQRVSGFLIKKQRLSERERCQGFLRAVQPADLQKSVLNRLQITKPHVHADDAYDLNDIYDAIKFALGSASSYTFTGTAGSASTFSPASEVTVKPDPNIAALLSAMTDMVKVMSMASQSNGGSAPTSKPAPSSSPKAPVQRPEGCLWEGDLSHYMGSCPNIEDGIKAGICIRNSEGRLVLPNGMYVPRSTPGKNFKERFENWHQANPGNKAPVVSTKMFETTGAKTKHASYLLTDDERERTLHTELMAIQTRRAAREALKADPKIAPAKPAEANETPSNAPEPPAGDFPTHPFSSARDAAYAPPRERNLGASSKPAQRPPVSQNSDAQAVFGAAMDTMITIPQRQLYSIAPSVRNLALDAFTPRRTSSKEAEQLLHEQYDPMEGLQGLVEETDAKSERCAAYLADSLPSSFSANVHSPPPNETTPPLDIFFHDSIPSADAELVVSLDSAAIRSVVAVVDNRQAIEAILDPGSQINAMSEAVCHGLGIPYDPTVVLQMQSANGAVNPSLGLARSVPFRIGNITLYLQVHVVRNPAYDILLGRPLDILTESVVHNYTNGDQTITLHDPNTGAVSTVPTIPRGSARPSDADFRSIRRSF